MGSVCKKQDAENELHSLIPKKKGDTITISQNHGGGSQIIQKKRSTGNKGDYEPDAVVEKLEVELKRNDKKKLVKVEARQDQEEIVENIQKSNKKKSPFDYQLILNSFTTNSLFQSLSQQEQEAILEQMFYCTTPDGQFVFRQGDLKASSFFLIERGQCQIIIDGEVKKLLKQSDSFGERALLYNAPRSASVRAVGDCAFWAIDRNLFRKMIEDMRMHEFEENRQFVENLKSFEFLTFDQRSAISSVLFTVQFKKGEIIVQQDETATSFFIIKKGSVSVIQNDNEIRKMKKGESFGEMALFQNSKRGATVKAAEEDVRCLVITRDELTKILGDKIQVIMFTNKQIWAIQKHQVLGQLTELQIQKIVQNMNQFNYEQGAVVFEEKVQKLVIVLKGELIFTGSKMKAASEGQVFGDAYFNKQELSDPVIAKDKSVLAEIDFKRFEEVIGGSLDQVINKNQKISEKHKKQESYKHDYSHLKLEEFVSLKKLGQGQFGNVYLVKNPKDNPPHFYALKCISKAQIVDQHLEKHLAQEKSVLTSVRHPFLMKYYCSFQDSNHVFFLVEFIKGMELFDVIRDIGLLSAFDTQFYIGSLILCIEYLNKQKIVYRDIKPENIMVDEKGYVRLIDMGTAKFLNHKGGRTYTIIGTPHYMAPEILQGKGYTFPVDIWSIGICMYEFMCGQVPYAEEAEDPYEIYEEIQKKQLSYPQFLKDRKAKKFMEQLLNKTPELRLGGSYASLKAHQWFDQFDWDKLYDKEMKAPYLPPQQKMPATGKDVQGTPIMKELQNLNAPVYRKEKAKDPNWDQEY
ncbi:unnamed protein product (macronuclear) [Paramecium tetraurelia]|uniref:cGMP-dependent protein kinase n=1 Tax=Paramecium tetraurelia TaxID=5888 RepID=A0DP02_PARTE|nr:uncharacterized protein GSPATT00018965001 [Paramecium tetraurelia]CAK84769.1 unnamed protein product [Paramecium tetraurelia]|eukprot:XP_001452166.1 hypothetical protein (macronuclear) [Paramecium tetraurelia strain d4-2]